MAEVRRRRASTTKTTVQRRRDVEPVEDDEEEDVDATQRPAPRRRPRGVEVRTRRAPAPVDDDEEDEEDAEDEEEEAPRRRTKAKARRRPEPEEDEDEDEDEEEDDDEEDEEPPARKRRPAARAKTRTPARRSARNEALTRRFRADLKAFEDEDEDEEPAPRKRTTASRRVTKKKASTGVGVGLSGVESVRKLGGSGVARVTLNKTPVLVKVLDAEPFATFRQHWIPQGGKKNDRPYTCIGKEDCPICALGDYAGQQVCFNVLDLTSESEPKIKMLQMGIKAYKAFETNATPKGKDDPNFKLHYWAISRSGTGQQSQTNFRLVKDRDLEEDWPEVFEEIDPEDLEAIIEESEDNKFDSSIVQVSTKKQLAEVARYLADDDDEDEDDD